MIITIILLAFTFCTHRPKGPITPQRAYTGLEIVQLYNIIEKVFKEEGFLFVEQDLPQGYLETNWLEYPGEKYGLVEWVERKKYEINIGIDRLNNNRYFFSLKLSVEERAPLSRNWRPKKNFNPINDKQYLRILDKIDNAVKQLGGRFGWMHKKCARG